jgi:hypothetical protein
MITLGEKIFLKDFEKLELPELLIAKKLVGSYIRDACKRADCKKAEIMLEISGKEFHIHVHVELDNNKIIECSAAHTNVFIAIDKALKKVLSEL